MQVVAVLPLNEGGTPHLCGSPASLLRSSPSVALSNDKEFRSLRRATAELGGSAKPFEKGLSENFYKASPLSNTFSNNKMGLI